MSKLLAGIAYIEGTLIGLVLAILVYNYSWELANMYTSNQDMVGLLSSVLKVMSISVSL